MPNDEPGSSLFEPGRNCWRVARADRLSLLVDGAEYFAALREALILAERQVLLIGWDFDLEIEMLPGESDESGRAPDGFPNALGAFLEAIVDRSENLELYLLKWNGAILAAPGRLAPSLALQVFSDDCIHFALDGHHPLGACHHQKIVVVDDSLAFCGGIDTTEQRWDTSDHIPNDPRRTMKDGSPAGPWHDATTALTGPIAGALGELSRRRWFRATGNELPELQREGEASPIWPASLDVHLRDVDVAIARTHPPYDGEELVNEIEELYLDAVRAARDVIYIESQYFTTGTVCAAIEERLRERGGPEVVVLNPQAALGTLEDSAMHPLRARMVRRMEAADHEDRFRIYHPVDAEGEPIYVHAKVVSIDDRLLRMGSSNLDDRSMGFDTECDIAFEGTDAASRAAIEAFRLRLVGEHLNVEPEAVGREWEDRGSLIAAIDHLSPPEGRGLRDIVPLKEGMLDRWLADSRLLDRRFYPGERSLAGRLPQPRQLLATAVVVGAVAALWYVLRPRGRDGGDRRRL